MNEGIVVIAHEASNLQNVHYDVEAFENRATVLTLWKTSLRKWAVKAATSSWLAL